MKFDKKQYGFVVDCKTTYFNEELGKYRQHPWYTCWINMIKRCYDESNPSYKTYGGRGVYVDDSFKLLSEFKMFYLDNNPNGILELDKDILGKGYYGCDSVLFVSKKANLLESAKRNGFAELPRASGNSHHKYRSKEYYIENKTTKSNFKKICETQGWDYTCFKEIPSGERASDRHMLYFFEPLNKEK